MSDVGSMVCAVRCRVMIMRIMTMSNISVIVLIRMSIAMTMMTVMSQSLRTRMVVAFLCFSMCANTVFFVA